MKIIEADIPFCPESVCDGLLLQWGEKAAIIFLATQEKEDGKWHDIGLAVLKSSSVLKTKYGHPNDEAFSGHPLWEYGLEHYPIAEVVDTPWIDEIAEVNEKVFPNTRRIFESCRHHIFAFKECTLEILWGDYEYEITDRTTEEVVEELIPWLSAY